MTVRAAAVFFGDSRRERLAFGGSEAREFSPTPGAFAPSDVGTSSVYWRTAESEGGGGSSVPLAGPAATKATSAPATRAAARDKSRGPWRCTCSSSITG